MSFFKSDEQKLKEQEEKNYLLNQKIIEKQKNIDIKNKLQQEQQNEIKLFSIMKKSKQISYKSSMVNRFKDWRQPTKTMLIHMELTNGFHTQFIVILKKNKTFKFHNGTYIVDNNLKYYDIACKLWCLDYHEGLALPVERKIDLNFIKKTVEEEGITDVDTAINPLTLKQFVESEVIEKAMKGQEMDKVFKFIKLFLILIACGVALTTLILVQSSGMLSDMSIPFLG